MKKILVISLLTLSVVPAYASDWSKEYRKLRAMEAVPKDTLSNNDREIIAEQHEKERKLYVEHLRDADKKLAKEGREILNKELRRRRLFESVRALEPRVQAARPVARGFLFGVGTGIAATLVATFAYKNQDKK